MSTSNSGSPSSPSLEEQVRITNDYHKFLNTASFATLFVAPVLLLIPPRKLDFYSFSLCGAWVASASHQNMFSKIPRPFGLPRTSTDVQERQKPLVEAREQRPLLEEPSRVPLERKKGTPLEEKAKEIWMGGETEGWKERRLKEEQEKLAQGEGYGSMIMDQIWEVWNWGDKREKSKENESEDVDKKG